MFTGLQIPGLIGHSMQHSTWQDTIIALTTSVHELVSYNQHVEKTSLKDTQVQPFNNSPSEHNFRHSLEVLIPCLYVFGSPHDFPWIPHFKESVKKCFMAHFEASCSKAKKIISFSDNKKQKLVQKQSEGISLIFCKCPDGVIPSIMTKH